MLGAIAGDIIGSVYEFDKAKQYDFPLFLPGSRLTDDSILTIATADVLINDGDYTELYRQYARTYPDSGYGDRFIDWFSSDDMGPYNSFGNGSAMRISPVAYFSNDTKEVLEEAERSAAVTHDHPEGIKGAQAVALCILMARQGTSRDEIRKSVSTRFGYDLDRKLDDIRPAYCFDVTCQGSVPESIIAFLESTDYEDAIRKAISLGGDTDTMACITGGMAEAFYGRVPEKIARETISRLPNQFLKIIRSFYQSFDFKSIDTVRYIS